MRNESHPISGRFSRRPTALVRLCALLCGRLHRPCQHRLAVNELQRDWGEPNRCGSARPFFRLVLSSFQQLSWNGRRPALDREHPVGWAGCQWNDVLKEPWTSCSPCAAGICRSRALQRP